MPIERSYERQADALFNYKQTGWDLALDSQSDYDLMQSARGDFITVDGADSIIESLIRRALTPTGGYAKWVKGSFGWEPIGVGFGNNSALFLSQPNTDLTSLEEAVWNAVKDDGRVTLINVQAYESAPNAVAVRIQYRLASESQIREESLSLG